VVLKTGRDKDTFDFLSEDVVEAAQALLGCRIQRIQDAAVNSFRIIETEAYHQSEPGSHSFRGKTKRNAVMFGNYGCLYVYLIYGVYHCANIVTGRINEGAAVLIRAIELVTPDEQLTGENSLKNPTDKRYSGPGKLCRELNITKALNGVNLLDGQNGELYLSNRPASEKIIIESSIRIGLSRASELKWRFFEADNPRVSKR
jgi:DNA-3-methyladenine glycosylase